MNVWFWMILFNGMFCAVRPYENLSKRSTTTVTQSSMYTATVFHTAYLTKDGVLNTTNRYCAHTAPNNPTAWLQVDLGRLYRIRNVKIYFRREGNGTKDWQQYRSRQFYLDASNQPVTQTTTAQRTRCYTDNSTAQVLPPHIIDIPCKHTARYVIVETNYDAPEDDPVMGAMLEICEIEVYGCDDGKYGLNCASCPECSSCDIITGACDCSANCKYQRCNSTGGLCTSGCTAGHWGLTCNNDCPDNCESKNCTDDTGTCYECKSGYWGGACRDRCPRYCTGNTCDQTRGHCTDGCITGRSGLTCNETCSARCLGGTCDQLSGTCSAGCVQNWIGDRCDVPQVQSSWTDNTVVFYGVVGGLCLSFTLNILSCILCLRRKNTDTRCLEEADQRGMSLSTFNDLPPPPMCNEKEDFNSGYLRLEKTASLYDRPLCN